MYRLLKRGDSVLLFPGGVSEAYHKRWVKNEMRWGGMEWYGVGQNGIFDGTE